MLCYDGVQDGISLIDALGLHSELVSLSHFIYSKRRLVCITEPWTELSIILIEAYSMGPVIGTAPLVMQFRTLNLVFVFYMQLSSMASVFARD